VGEYGEAASTILQSVHAVPSHEWNAAEPFLELAILAMGDDEELRQLLEASKRTRLPA